MTSVSKLILLHPDDNVLVCCSPIKAGEAMDLDGQTAAAPCDIAVGHKVARTALKIGDRVIKYGAPVGAMTRAAAAGDHVHVHNLGSNYVSSLSRTPAGAAGAR